MLKRYLTNTSGNVAMMFGLSISVLMVCIGAAIDFSGASKQQTDLQNMVDAAVLAAAKSRSKDKAELQKIVDATLAFHNTEGWDITAVVRLQDDELQVTADMKYDTTLMGMVGRDKLNLSADTASPIAKKMPINLALVLDTTGSMAGDNMNALITAGSDMMDQLDEMGSTVNVSLVPFGEYVNVGMEQRGQVWLDTSKDGTVKTTDYCYIPKETITAPTCTETGRTITTPQYSDGVYTGDSSYPERTCTGGEYRDLPEECGTTTVTYTWHGCVNSRPDPYNMSPEYNARQIPANFNSSSRCGQKLIPLTDNLETIKTGIENLEARGETYLPSGLIWGWRTLDPDLPFDQAKTKPKNAATAILLMTDGANTRNLLSDGTHNGSDGEAGLAKTKGLCDQIKSDGIQIFTVAYRLPGGAEDTAAVLEYCASSPGQSFAPDNAAQLTASFENIGNMLDVTRLSY